MILPTNVGLLGLERLAMDKHSSLLQTFVTTDVKGFIVLGPDVLVNHSWGLTYKPFKGSN